MLPKQSHGPVRHIIQTQATRVGSQNTTSGSNLGTQALSISLEYGAFFEWMALKWKRPLTPTPRPFSLRPNLPTPLLKLPLSHPTPPPAPTNPSG